MGYGQGETVGRSGDGGIDGIIDQDALGLEKVYIQAKRWGRWASRSVKSVSPERAIGCRLLVKMGYGQGETVGRSGDGGIDGIIDQDALGLEKVYIQAKRWGSQVGEPEIRNFSGSLDPYGATKGVFITTSTFSSTARQTAQNISAGNKLIRLVDGDELARLMIRYGVGVVTETTYEVKKLDENYFAEDV